MLRTGGGLYTVQRGEDVFACALRGRLKASLYVEEDDGSKRRVFADPVSVGDRVAFLPLGQNGIIEDVLPRTTRLSRIDTKPHPTAPDVEHVIVANCDQVIIVVSSKRPRLNLRFVDRLLLIAQYGGVEPLLCVNKSDLLKPDERAALIETIERIYPPIGARWLLVSAATGEELDRLRAVLEGRFSAFAGVSGTGKSSLLNALDPSLSLRTATVSDWSNKGRHTTTAVERFQLGRETFVADTPGIRVAGLWGIPDGLLDSYFVEMRQRRADCRFNDCWHLEEPGCAVRRAVSEGRIARERYDSYRRLCGDGAQRR